MTAYIDPTSEQFRAMMKDPWDGPVHMLNLIRLKDKAAYQDGRDATGAEAYAAYGRESAAIFKRVGGEIVWSGEASLMVIGPGDKRWDIAFIAAYPSASAFGDMVKDPAYQAIVFHRQAAVEDSRLIRLQPRPPGSGFA